MSDQPASKSQAKRLRIQGVQATCWVRLVRWRVSGFSYGLPASDRISPEP